MKISLTKNLKKIKKEIINERNVKPQKDDRLKMRRVNSWTRRSMILSFHAHHKQKYMCEGRWTSNPKLGPIFQPLNWSALLSLFFFFFLSSSASKKKKSLYPNDITTLLFKDILLVILRGIA